MKKISEIGVFIIKDLEHKAGNEAMKMMLFRINDILYPAQTKYALPEVVTDTLNRLIEVGKECKELHCSDRYQPKKDEILKCLRERCNALTQYITNYVADEREEKDAINKTMRYQLSVSIKAKNDFVEKADLNIIVQQLENNKRIYQLLSKKITAYDIDIKQFEKVQDELIEIFAHEYSITKEA